MLDAVLGVCVPFPLVVLDKMWKSIVSVLDHCLFHLLWLWIVFNRTRQPGRWQPWRWCNGSSVCSLIHNLFPEIWWYVKAINWGLESVIIAFFWLARECFSLTWSSPQNICRRFKIHQTFWWHGASLSYMCEVQKSIMLCIPAFFRTSITEILSCHLIFKSFLSLSGSGAVCLHDICILEGLQ